MHANSTALYVQISRKIFDAIKNGEYAENAPLPSERFLCRKYHVSRSTVRQAIQLLKEADAVYTVQGNGTFIKPQVYTQPLTRIYSFADTLKNSGVLIQNTIVGYERVTADASLARNADCAVGTDFHQIVRLRSAKEYPLMLETTYLPCARFAALDLDALAKGSLYDFLRENYDFHADNIQETLRPVMPRPEEKALLQMPANIPCILLERFSYEGDRLIEYTKSIVRGDKYIFRVDLRG